MLTTCILNWTCWTPEAYRRHDTGESGPWLGDWNQTLSISKSWKIWDNVASVTACHTYCGWLSVIVITPGSHRFCILQNRVQNVMQDHKILLFAEFVAECHVTCLIRKFTWRSASILQKAEFYGLTIHSAPDFAGCRIIHFQEWIGFQSLTIYLRVNISLQHFFNSSIAQKNCILNIP